MPVRRNAAALSGGQRRAFVAAVLELKRRGGYDELVTIHFDRMTADAAGQRVGHQSPSFLPWHRRYLLDFERLTHGREVLALAPGQGRDLGELAREHEGPHALVRQGVRRGRPEVTDEALREGPVGDAD